MIRIRQRRSWLATGLSHLAMGLVLVSALASAGEKSFTLDGASITLTEATSSVDVYFQSLRFNRSLSVWNVELTVSNKSSAALEGPLVLLVESFTGTSGPPSPDGNDGGLPAKSFYDLSGYAGGSALLPGQKTSPRTLTLGFTGGAPSLVTKFYVKPAVAGVARAFTRTLNDAGQPLPGALVEETGSQGQTTNTTDGLFGIATLGQGTGGHAWKFSAPGFLPVWRQFTLTTGAVANLPTPRLTPRSANVFNLSPIAGGTLSNREDTVQITFLPGSFTQSTTGRVTSLTGQTLPGFLPQGWSPLQAFWLELGNEPTVPGSANLTPWGALNNGESAAFTRWNPNTLAWDVLTIGGNADVPLPGSGAFALVVGDTGPLAPPAPTPGAALQPSLAAPPNLSSLVATGAVQPSVSSASLIPELVTANAQVIVSNQTGNLPSGLLLRCEIADQYQLTDGSRRRVPQYENFVVGYQRPGDNFLSTVHANFPLRPMLLLDGDELDTATIKVDVITNGPFAGGLLDTNGGQVATEDIRVLAGIGDLLSSQAVQLRKLDPTNFSEFNSNGMQVLRAFDLAVTGVASNHHLRARFGPMPTNSFFVLAKVLSEAGVFGVEPRERLVSNGTGNLDSEDSVDDDDHLPGIIGAGEYLLLKVPSRQGLVRGIARNAQGQPAGNLLARAPPWLTFSAGDGRYRLLAPTGSVTVAVTDLATGDTGSANTNLPNPLLTTILDASVAQSSPSVLAVFPTAGATAVPRVTPVSVTFSKRINPATLLGNAIQLLGLSNQPVAATLTLNLKNTVATLLPTDPLAPNTLHTISLSTNIADMNGRNLTGPSQFSFTTATDSLNRPAGGQVISYEPTNGVARMEGTQGIADPNAPVILVNESSGRTATVLSSVDGGFTNSIEADVNDFLSAVLVNQNGTRTTIPVSRQMFADGRVGLFRSGGELKAQNAEETVTLTIPPGAIGLKTIFLVTNVNVTNLLAEVGNTSPTNGQLLAALRITSTGDTVKEPVRVKFEIPPSRLPSGYDLSNLVFAAMAPRTNSGVTAYEFFGTGTAAITPAAPRPAGGPPGAAKFGDAGIEFSLGGGAFSSGLDFLLATLMDPALYSPATTIGVAGPVQTALVTGPNTLVPGTETPLAGAAVTVAAVASPLAQLLRFQPGEVYTVSDQNGHYSLIAPQLVAGNGYAAVATHLRFPRTYAASGTFGVSGGAMTLRAPITFGLVPNPPDIYPPAIFASHTPLRPQPGSNTVLTVFAVDDGVSVPVTIEGPPYTVTGAGATSDSVQVSGTGPFTVTCSNAAKVVLVLKATDNATPPNERRMPYAVNFGGTEIFAPDPDFPANTNDTVAPYVLGTVPPTAPVNTNVALVAGGVGLRPGDPIIIRFSEPMARAVESDPETYITLLTNNAGQPTARLHENQRELHVSFPALEPDATYEFTIQSVRDVSGNMLDQDPGTNQVPSFSFKFRTAPQFATAVPNTYVENGGGAVIHGIFAYVLDRGGVNDGALMVLDLSDPKNPTPAGVLDLPGYPRDLALIPHYSFRRGPLASAVETNDLLAVVGGPVTGDVASQYLYVISLTNPISPSVVATAIVSPDPTAAITRVAWQPPNLVLVESRASYAAVHLVELQRFIFGRNTKPPQYPLLPVDDTPGLDANLDGDFTDPGDTLPLPGLTTVGYPGLVDSFTLDRFGRQFTNDFLVSTTRAINDAALGAGGSLIGMVAGTGTDVTANPPGTNEVPGLYRSYLRDQDLDGFATSVLFTNHNPKRVMITDDIRWPVTNTVGTNLVFTLTNRTLAFVVSVAQDNSDSKLSIVDVTVNPTNGFPGTNVLKEITFAVTNFDLVQAIGRSDDGRILLATTTNIIVIEPSLLAATNTPVGTNLPVILADPSVTGVIRNAAAGATDFSLTSYGLGAASLRGRTVITLLSPDVRIVNGQPTGANRVVLPDQEFPAGYDLAQDIMRFETPLFLGVATNNDVTNFTTIYPLLHHQVLVRAPGSATNKLQLRLESLDALGNLLYTGSPSNVPPAVLTDLTASRVADDSSQPEYNFFLSTPFVLVPGRMAASNYVNLTNIPFARHLLLAGNGLRASLADSLSNNPVIGPFATSFGSIPAPGAEPPPPGPPPGPPSPPPPAPPSLPPIVFLQPGAGSLVAPGLTPVISQPTNDARFTLETTVDNINHLTCPGRCFFTFTLPHAALVSLTLRPDTNVASTPRYVSHLEDFASGNILSNFYNLPYPAGTHTVVIDGTTLGDPGEHLYELTATNLPFFPFLALTNRGILEHKVRLNNNFPVAHTMIEGVDLADGHVSVSRQDVMIPGRKLSLEFTRSYGSSGNSHEGPLGAGWTHNYNCRVVTNECGLWSVIGGEGSGNAFQDTLPAAAQAILQTRYAPLLLDRTDPLNRFAGRKFLKPQKGYHSALVIYSNAPTHVDFFTKSGVRYHFVLDPYAGAPGVFTLRDITEPNHNYIVLSYHPDGDGDPRTLDLVSEVDANGTTKRGLVFEYAMDTNYHKLRIARVSGTNFTATGSADLQGLRIDYAYDQWGNLTNVTRAGSGVPGLNDQRVENYGYSPGDGIDGHNLTNYVDPNGNVTGYTFDPVAPPPPSAYYANFAPPGNYPTNTDSVPPHETVRKVTHVGATPAADVVTSFDYDFNTHTTIVHSPRENESPGVPPTTYVMNQYGATLEIQAPHGQTTRMKWATDNPLGRTFDEFGGPPPEDALMVEKTDAEGRVHEYHYMDGHGNLTKETIIFATKPVTKLGANVPFVELKYAYDLLFNQRTNATDAEGNATSYGINPATGNLESVTDAENQTTTYHYYANGDLQERIDPRGFRTTYAQSLYDEFGNAREVKEEAAPGIFNTTTRTFDERSRMRTSVGAFRHDAAYDYDGLDRKISETRHNSLGAAGPDRTTGWRYRPNGELEFATNGLGHLTQHVYDKLNRKIVTYEHAVTQATLPAFTYSNRFTYDRAHNVLTETDPRGIIRTHAYDALNRKTNTVVAGPSTPVNLRTFAGQYDRMNNLISETDLHGNTTLHLYDGLYRVVTNVLPFQSRTVLSDYNLAGSTLSTTDANGHKTRMGYDRVYRLVGSTNAENIATVFAYDASGNKTNEHNLSTGLRTGYGNIDGLNRARLISQTVPDGPGPTTVIYDTVIQFDDAQNVMRQTNPRGFTTLTAKDGLDRVYQVKVNENAGGGAPTLTTTFTYDANGNQLDSTDDVGSGPDVTHQYDELNRRFRSIYVAAPDANGATHTDQEEFVYDGNGNLTQRTDKRGVVFYATYDNLNRVLEQHVLESITPLGSDLRFVRNDYNDLANSVTMTDANNNPTATSYDQLNRPIGITNALNQIITFEYDGVNKIAEVDRNLQSTEFYYDAINRLTNTVEKKLGGSFGTMTTVKYEDALRRRTETDRNGFDTIFQLDGLGRLVQRLRSDASASPPTNNLLTLYGGHTRLMETRAYDENSNLIAVADANNNRIAYTYDGLDRKIGMTNGVGGGVGIVGVTVYTYDLANNLITEKDGRNSLATADWVYGYDDRYRKDSATDGEGRTTTYAYDANNNLARVTEPEGLTYTTRYLYDEFGKLLTVDEGARGGGTTSFAYDGNRNKISQTDASGNQVTYHYDALNRLTNTLQVASPGPSLSWGFGYDGNGNQTSIRDARNQIVNVIYDWLDRPIARLYSAHAEKNAGQPLRFQPIAFTNVLDGNGNLLVALERKADGTGGFLSEATTFAYDPLNRPLTRTHTDHDGTNKTITCRYDLQGNRTNLVDPDGFETHYAFDVRNRLTNVLTEANTGTPRQTTYQWWEDDLLKRINYPNGTFTDRSSAGAYDKADRVKHIENRSVATIFSQYDYTYDANGNRTNQVEVQFAFGAPEATSYTYDALNRLKTVTYGSGGSLTYAYAQNGNRLSEVGTDPVTLLPVNRTFIYTSTGPKTYSGVNALARITNNLVPGDVVDYEYDANLNQTARVQGAVRRDFRFDIRDQIAETTQAGSTTTFDYNADRLRVKKIDPTTGETRYLYDQSSVLVEYGGASTGYATHHKYDYGYALLSLTTVTGPRVRNYYLTDGLRSTANLTDDAGLLQHSYRYDAWGRIRTSAGTTDNPRQYTGHYKDTETGLHYFGARYYDEEQGRFLSQDPYLGEANTPPSLHRFLYAYANPLRYVDLTGYESDAANPDAQPGPTLEAAQKLEQKQTEEKEKQLEALDDLTKRMFVNPVIPKPPEPEPPQIRPMSASQMERASRNRVRTDTKAVTESSTTLGQPSLTIGSMTITLTKATGSFTVGVEGRIGVITDDQGNMDKKATDEVGGKVFGQFNIKESRENGAWTRPSVEGKLGVKARVGPGEFKQEGVGSYDFEKEAWNFGTTSGFGLKTPANKETGTRERATKFEAGGSGKGLKGGVERSIKFNDKYEAGAKGSCDVTPESATCVVSGRGKMTIPLGAAGVFSLYFEGEGSGTIVVNFGNQQAQGPKLANPSTQTGTDLMSMPPEAISSMAPMMSMPPGGEK